MLVGVLPLLRRLLILLLAGVAAGIANGVAGGGNLITFPTLLGLGIPALQADLSTSVGVVPSYVGSLRLYRHDLARHRAHSLTSPPVRHWHTQRMCAALEWIVVDVSIGRAVLFGAGTVLFGAPPLITRALANVDHTHPLRRWSL